MQYAQLRAFHAVALHGGFSRAAEALHLTQPAISDQVRSLEQEFGVSLFNRMPRSVDLTPLGRRLLDTTRRFFEAEDEARDILGAAGSLRSGTLRLYSDAPYLAMPLVLAFRSRYPGIEVNIRSGNAEECLDSVLAYEADAAISSATRSDARLETLIIHREPLAAIVHLDHPLAKKRRTTLAALAEMPVIFREPRSGTRRLFEEELARNGLTCRPTIDVEGREALREAVAAGIGIGIMARAERGSDPRTACVEIVDASSMLTEALVRRADRAPSAPVDALFDVARDHVGDQQE